MKLVVTLVLFGACLSAIVFTGAAAQSWDSVEDPGPLYTADVTEIGGVDEEVDTGEENAIQTVGDGGTDDDSHCVPAWFLRRVKCWKPSLEEVRMVDRVIGWLRNWKQDILNALKHTECPEDTEASQVHD